MATQNLLVANTSSHDGYGATAIGLQDNATVMDSGLVSGSWQCWIWALFQLSASIAQGSTFSSATLRLQAAEDKSDSTWEIDWHLEKVANATAPSGSFSSLSGKTLTTAAARYTNTVIASGVYEDFDLASPMNELSAAYALASGDYVLAVGKFVSGTNKSRRFYQRDNGTSTDPEFNLDYTAGGGATGAGATRGKALNRLRLVA